MTGIGFKLLRVLLFLFFFALTLTWDVRSYSKVNDSSLKHLKNTPATQKAYYIWTHRLTFHKSISGITLSPHRSWRLVSSHLWQVPVAGGRPGREDQDHRRRHAGPLRQLWLAVVLPADVQRHGTQLEAVQAGGQYRGECRTSGGGRGSCSILNGAPTPCRSCRWQPGIQVLCCLLLCAATVVSQDGVNMAAVGFVRH